MEMTYPPLPLAETLYLLLEDMTRRGCTRRVLNHVEVSEVTSSYITGAPLL